MWWVAIAGASAPEVQVRADHSVVGVALVAATPDVVRGKIADPSWVAATDASGTRVTVVERRGDCLVADRESPNVITTVRSRTEQCATPTGFVETLVSSRSFDAYRAQWTVEPVPGGARITYDLAMSTSMLVPQAIIDQQARKGVQTMLVRLQEAFGGPP